MRACVPRASPGMLQGLRCAALCPDPNAHQHALRITFGSGRLNLWCAPGAASTHATQVGALKRPCPPVPAFALARQPQPQLAVCVSAGALTYSTCVPQIDLPTSTHALRETHHTAPLTHRPRVHAHAAMAAPAAPHAPLQLTRGQASRCRGRCMDGKHQAGEPLVLLGRL